MKPPCRENGVDCPHRKPGCQDSCAKLEKLHAYYDAVRKARTKDEVYIDYIVPIVTKGRQR